MWCKLEDISLIQLFFFCRTQVNTVNNQILMHLYKQKEIFFSSKNTWKLAVCFYSLPVHFIHGK